ncbi:MAG: 1-acyl-sn-glycerol-3-phosphate acyltransferase [Porphyromonadaceae bacterium]|nr:MAG: 1-acyl-sn-glycerol-3-phosphate acyltransferase [Porphyromonadaceae bacterium]
MNLPLIIQDTYHTPENTHCLWLHRVLPHVQIAFKYKFLRINFHARKLSVRGLYPTEEWARSSYQVMKLLESCGGRFHISGLENIRKCTEPVVFIGNHMSTLETMVLPYLIAQIKDVTFVVKDSLVKSWAFGPVMKSRDPIVVSRHNSREDLVTVMTQGQEILANGRSVVIFPQSTRRTEFRPEEFNSLGVKLASKSGVQVIPFALKTDFWLNGKFVKDLGPLDQCNKDIYFTFGQPMDIKGTGKEENKAIIDFIQANLAAWKT